MILFFFSFLYSFLLITFFKLKSSVSSVKTPGLSKQYFNVTSKYFDSFIEISDAILSALVFSN